MKHNKHRTPDEVKIYHPKDDVISAYKTYPVTDNYTTSDGHVFNRSEENIVVSKEWVEENEK